MTLDPERLLNHTGLAGAFERELLASLRAEAPPDGAREMAWNGLAHQLGVLGAAGTAASLAAPTTAAAAQAGGDIVAAGGFKTALLAPKALLVKAAIVLSVGAAGAGGLLWATKGSRDAAVAAHSPARPAARVLPREMPAAAPLTVETPEEAVPVTGREASEPGARRGSVDAERATQLSRESALLIRARAELRAGDVAGARATLGELERRFPRGMLTQEREVLHIELVAARGELAAAKRRANAFVHAHPKSPHSGKLARFLSEP